MINKCEIRERILNFFKTKKLCKQAYTTVFYKSDPEVYEWVLHYFDGVPSLEHTSLAQKLWHIDHQINEALPYVYENINHVYVIDFVDHINKQVYEIKPEAYCKIEPNITKIAAGKQWCKENNYTYNLITEKELCL